MPLSDDPEKRQRQLANLPNLRGEVSVGAPATSATHVALDRRSQAAGNEKPPVTGIRPRNRKELDDAH